MGNKSLLHVNITLFCPLKPVIRPVLMQSQVESDGTASETSSLF